MRAVQYTAFGDPYSAAKLVDAPEPPQPGPGEVLLGIEYAPVNVNDLLLIGGRLPKRPDLPAFAGNEAVGKVLGIGPDVTTVKVGDRALPPLYSGTWRERMIVPASGLFALPENADIQQLAMTRINPMTAALMLTEYVDLKPGDWVVQNAGNSGVGRAVIAFAKDRGVKTISFVRRQKLVAELEAAGGDVVFVDGPDAVKQAAEQVGDGKVRLAIDGLSGPATARLADFLSQGATLVGYAMMSGDASSPADLRPLMSKSVSLAFFYMGRPQFAEKVAPLLPVSARLIASGALHVPIAATYPMSQVRDAIGHVQRGGKVMLKIAD
jgi:NADPH:quinone reductase-like Zn-dependent oxidoreductase